MQVVMAGPNGIAKRTMITVPPMAVASVPRVQRIPGLHSCLRQGVLLLALAGAAPAQAQDAMQADNCVRLPFDQQLDLAAVTALAHEAPEALLARIASLGIDVRRVPSARPDRPVNPLLVGLPVAEAHLLQQAEFLNNYLGRSIPGGAACCGLERATVLIRETASTYTLLHEVVHLLLVPTDGAAPLADVELRFATAFHRLTLFQRRLYDDPFRLLDPRWRRDIVAAQQEVAALIYDRLRIGQSQEVIVEQVLAGCVDERSPYFDVERRVEGRRYGEAMIDNAVDVFNALHASVEYCDETVRNLRQELAEGRLSEMPQTRLSAQDQQEFADAAQGVRQAMARVRSEIESLKRFYSR